MLKHLEDFGKQTKQNSNIFTTLGASNHAIDEREENDYYATDPEALQLLLNEEKFNNIIFEPCCGGGHLVKVLESNDYNVITNDINQYEQELIFKEDFLNYNFDELKDLSFDIITNPPYKLALEFVQKSLSLVKENDKVCMFLRIQFLEGIERYSFFKENPPRTIYVLSKRYPCAKNGEFYKDGKKIGSAICYAWFIWEKGFKGNPIIKWLL